MAKMSFKFVSVTLALGFINIVLGQQVRRPPGKTPCQIQMLTGRAVIRWRTKLCSKLSGLWRSIGYLGTKARRAAPNKQSLQETCYSRAVSLIGCAPEDLPCQCTPVKQAGIVLAGGPCFLGSCALADRSSFSSAWTAACATATVPASALNGAVAAQATGENSNPGAKTNQLGAPIETAMAQQQEVLGDTEITVDPRIAVTVIAVGLLMMIVGGVVLAYCVTVARKRRDEKKRYKALEREKSAMQASLEELQRAVSRQNTAEGFKGAGTTPRPTTIIVNWKEGPQELMVPPTVFHELPASPAAWEKM